MGVTAQIEQDALPTASQGTVHKTSPEGTKTRCLLAGGSSVLISNFLASFVRTGDELLFCLQVKATDAGTQIYLRSGQPGRPDLFQAEVGYTTHPRKGKQGNLFVSAEVIEASLRIFNIHLPCEVLRDYFYVGDRGRAWDQQPSLYELLHIKTNASPAELRLGFRVLTLELRTLHARDGERRALERAFNILASPELRACYDTLLNNPDAPVLFPYGGLGSLLVAGHCSRDGTAFYASRILSFLPKQKTRCIRVPLRRCTFCDGRAIYRDSRQRLEITFDQAVLPLSWNSEWNQWKHLLGAKITVAAAFVHTRKYQQRSGTGQLAHWDAALPSRIEVSLPTDIAEQINQVRHRHHRFGQFADALNQIRKRTESAPIERDELQKLCAELGIPGDFDLALITWKADYDDFYYRQLCERARFLYFFRSEYIFDLEKAVIVEIPQLGYATYLFSKPASMTSFLALYTKVTRRDILQNRKNAAEKLGFVGRIIHGIKPQGWLKELRLQLAEILGCAESSE